MSYDVKTLSSCHGMPEILQKVKDGSVVIVGTSHGNISILIVDYTSKTCTPYYEVKKSPKDEEIAATIVFDEWSLAATADGEVHYHQRREQ